MAVLVRQHHLVAPAPAWSLDDPPRNDAVGVSIMARHALVDTSALILPGLAVIAIAAGFGMGGAAVVHVPDLGSRERRNKRRAASGPPPRN